MSPAIMRSFCIEDIVELAGADFRQALATVGGEQTKHELLVGHFQAEHADGVARLLPRIGGLVVTLVQRIAARR